MLLILTPKNIVFNVDTEMQIALAYPSRWASRRSSFPSILNLMSVKNDCTGRRLFYVGLTRARDEIHMLYSGYIDTDRGKMRLGRSPFLDELEARMKEAEGE